ncbi:uncharacterized protein MONBRDRAFT_31043 [Monosiga brevicollis MX1]|uniref:SAM domain-containing protein n=1 Tax=Monosiga brevicollis TaxID=81824 RepID=A9UQW5_MONBE|nr:uncharacterized protein MONBRDRAFT_31043 [Monosiga brevicollis MX1]EDQ92670.1 predicted protein [Monosiga brevicollis MX1]|eukprot:XP_001742432.1 hypothetical protein [Monosiga brevicollis MX1]
MAAGTSSVLDWLKGLKLDSYHDAFVDAGFDTLDKVAMISSEDLDRMNITLQGHRNRILRHVPKQPAELDDILDGLSSLVDDMTMQVDTEAAPSHLDGTDANDLDDILADLYSFSQDDSGQPKIPAPYHAPATENEGEAGANTEGSTAEAIPAAKTTTPSAVEAAAPAPSADVERPVIVSTTANFESSAAVSQHLDHFSKRLSSMGQISTVDLENMMKEEKIRIAMSKLAAAQMQKNIIHVFMEDATKKTICVDATETAFEVCRKTVVKNRLPDDPFWTLVEVAPELALERFIEDHERKYFPASFVKETQETKDASKLTERAKRILFQHKLNAPQEYFSSTARLPDVKGWVQCREGKKWKKRFLLLRASGVYYSSKGESEASKDLVALVKFHECILCHGQSEFAKQVKAPSDFNLIFRPNIRKRLPELTDLIVLNFHTESDMLPWEAGARLAIHGNKLKQGFDDTARKFTELAHLGATPSSLASQLRQVPSQKSNDPALIQKWRSQRASKRNPNMSAATGVEFDDEADVDDAGLLGQAADSMAGADPNGLNSGCLHTEDFACLCVVRAGPGASAPTPVHKRFPIANVPLSVSLSLTCGSLQYVHTDCLLRWIDEKQASCQRRHTVRCPQCKTPFIVSVENRSLFVKIGDAFRDIAAELSPIVSVLSTGLCFWAGLACYGALVYRTTTKRTIASLIARHHPMTLISLLPLIPCSLVATNLAASLSYQVRIDHDGSLRIQVHTEEDEDALAEEDEVNAALAAWNDPGDAMHAAEAGMEARAAANPLFHDEEDDGDDGFLPEEDDENDDEARRLLEEHEQLEQPALRPRTAYPQLVMASTVGDLCFSAFIPKTFDRVVLGGLVYQASTSALRSMYTHYKQQEHAHRRIHNFHGAEPSINGP